MLFVIRGCYVQADEPTQAATQSSTQSISESASQASIQSSTQSITASTSQSTTQSAAQSSTQSTTASTSQSTAQSAAQSSTQSSTESTTEVTARSTQSIVFNYDIVSAPEDTAPQQLYPIVLQRWNNFWLRILKNKYTENINSYNFIGNFKAQIHAWNWNLVQFSLRKTNVKRISFELFWKKLDI